MNSKYLLNKDIEPLNSDLNMSLYSLYSFDYYTAELDMAVKSKIKNICQKRHRFKTMFTLN